MTNNLSNFTEESKRLLVVAQEEAYRFGHGYIGTEHFLLALLQAKSDKMASIALLLDLNLERMRESVRFIVGPGDHLTSIDISLTPRAKRIVELSVKEAVALLSPLVAPEHLFLGLLTEGEGIAIGILGNMGIESSHARRVALGVIKGPSEIDFEMRLTRTRQKVEGILDDLNYLLAYLRGLEEDYKNQKPE